MHKDNVTIQTHTHIYTTTMEYYSVIKKGEILSLVEKLRGHSSKWNKSNSIWAHLHLESNKKKVEPREGE